MDFNKKVIIHTTQEEWMTSPSAGVRRIPLERQEAESGHVTSVVEYLPGSSFSSHDHPLGEEILVLSGIFSDEKGNYEAGTYIRNPPGSSHRPYSKKGCRLFVKLNQMELDDQNHIVVRKDDYHWRPGYAGLEVMPLYQFATESVALVKWPKGEKFVSHEHFGGEEIFVLSGEFIDEFGAYPAGTWIRSPHKSQHCPYVEEETIIYVKTGHLK